MYITVSTNTFNFHNDIYSISLGQYDLQIMNVELSDEGSYVCQVNFMRQQYLSQTAVLTVQGK